MNSNSMHAASIDKRNPQTHHFTYTWPEKPGRFVSEDVQKDHTGYLEALSWAFFYSLDGKASQELKHPDKSNTDMYIIYDLHLVWEIKEYKWIKFDLFTSEDDKKSVLENCYELQCSKDFLNVIVHYASVGEEDPRYIMINGWIYKLFPQKLYIFLVGKRLRSTENTDEIKTAIKGQHKKSKYSEFREGINNCRGDDDLYNLWAEFARYARDILQGRNTNRNFNPSKEAWFTTYFTAAVISESVRNFRSFITTLMALDLSLSQNPEKTQEIILDNLPMTKGGTWINTDKRGFHGASSVVAGKRKKLQNLIDNEEKICKRWLSLSNKAEIDAEMMKRLLQVLYGEHRLSEDPSILETFIINYVHFIKEINFPVSPELLSRSHVPPISLQNINVSRLSSPIIPATIKPILIPLYSRDLRPKSIFTSLMCSYSSEHFYKHVNLYDNDLDWCRTETFSPLMPSVQTLVSSVLSTTPSRISINPAVLSSVNICIQFHQHFSTNSVDLREGLIREGLWKNRSKILMEDTFICLHLNHCFCKFIPLKDHVFRDPVNQSRLAFTLFPSEYRLWSLLRKSRSFRDFKSHVIYNITHRTSVTASGGFSLHVISEHWEQRHRATLHSRRGKEFQLHPSSFCVSFTVTQFHTIHLLPDHQRLNYSNLNPNRTCFSRYGNDSSSCCKRCF